MNPPEAPEKNALPRRFPSSEESRKAFAKNGKRIGLSDSEFQKFPRGFSEKSILAEEGGKRKKAHSS